MEHPIIFNIYEQFEYVSKVNTIEESKEWNASHLIDLNEIENYIRSQVKSLSSRTITTD